MGKKVNSKKSTRLTYLGYQAKSFNCHVKTSENHY